MRLYHLLYVFFGICKKHFCKGMYAYFNAYQKSVLV